MGYPRNFPRVIVFGPKELGGLGIRSVGHLRQPGRVGDMILCNLRWQQRLAGVSFHLWEHPQKKLNSILERGWITTGVREALAATKNSLHFTFKNKETELMLPPLARTEDSYSMDNMIRHYKGTPLYRINACRLWLRVTRLADIVSADGCHFRTGILDGSILITRNLQKGTRWPRQERPPKSWWTILEQSFTVCVCIRRRALHTSSIITGNVECKRNASRHSVGTLL
jgi:hypothetical protein